MACNQFDIPYRSVSCVAATAKTVVGVLASTNVALKILEVAVTADGATSSAVPMVVDFNRCTFATNPPGTASTAFVPNADRGKRDPGRAETIQATCAHTWTTEPTVHSAQHSKDVGQFNGVYHLLHPFSSPMIVVGAKGFAITITSPNTVNCTGHLSAEE